MTTQIEQTSKRWKAHIAVGGVTFLCGFPALVIHPVVGGLMIAGGAIWYIGARVAAWWHHG